MNRLNQEEQQDLVPSSELGTCGKDLLNGHGSVGIGNHRLGQADTDGNHQRSHTHQSLSQAQCHHQGQPKNHFQIPHSQEAH